MRGRADSWGVLRLFLTVSGVHVTCLVQPGPPQLNCPSVLRSWLPLAGDHRLRLLFGR